MSQHETVEILDPSGQVSGQGRRVPLATRFDDLDGRQITLYSNNKQNSDHFLEAVASALTAEHDVEVSEVVYKPAASSPGSRWGLLDEVAADTDAVLLAYGDCGSCTTYTVHDAIEFERRGIPTVSYSTDEFVALGQYDAFHRGCPGLPLVQIEHPMASIDADLVPTRVTDAVVSETVRALTGPASQLETEYAGRYSPDDFETRPSYDRCTF